MSERLVVLNVNYSNHDPEEGEIPSRESAILEFIKSQRKTDDEPGETTVVLIDTVWNERFGQDNPETGENKSLADHLGMRAAFHTHIDDQELNQKGWKKGIGITVATDHNVEESHIVRLGEKGSTRNALIVDLALAHTVSLAAIYLPETDSHAQMQQISDLDTELNGPHIIPKPSGYKIVAGDFNSLDKHENYDSFLSKTGSNLVRLGAKRIQRADEKSYWDKTLLTLDRRLIIPRMKHFGYHDANAGPTYPSRMPMLDPDHVFSFGINKEAVRTDGKGLSDHRAIVFDFTLR